MEIFPPLLGMRCRVISIFIALGTALTFQLSAGAGTVRVSFLNDPTSLSETIGMLTNKGCDETATVVFRRLVESHYAKGFNLDLKKFPKNEGGFYTFSEMIHLLKALPHRLSDSDHVWDFNCFETVAVLGSSKFRFKIRPDDNFGPFTVSMTMTNGDEAITLAATARDAFSRIVPAWYRDATEEYVPVAMKDARIILTAEFFRWHCLPMRTTEATLEGELWTALRSDWKRAGVIFPQEFEVILYHTANLQMVCTSHTGLLFAGNSGGFTYLEKAGGKGPFVRLDVDRKSDLFPWMKAAFDDRTQRDGRMFVSFNDTEILKLNSK